MQMRTIDYINLPGTPRWATEESGGLSKCDVIMWYRYHLAMQRVNSGMA